VASPFNWRNRGRSKASDSLLEIGLGAILITRGRDSQTQRSSRGTAIRPAVQEPTSGCTLRSVTRLLHDAHGRRISDLRVSVTDRCNFRCQYCMPADGIPWLERSEVLTFEEIERVVRLLV